MAGDNQDRAAGITDDMFGDAPNHRMLESRAAMSGSDDEINVWLARCRADFVYCVTWESFGLNG